MENTQPILFFDVDTQLDFIEPDGALYVPGAETLKPRYRQLIRYARINEIPVWGSVDAHKDGDPELIQNDGPFPEHCMQDSPGQQKIPETTPIDPTWIANQAYSDQELSQLKKNVDELYFEKQSYDMFDNPNLEKLIDEFHTVVIFGVATDYCILTAVRGFSKAGKAVLLVADAIKPVTEKSGQDALIEMKQTGAVFIKTNDILNGILFD